MGIEYDDLRMEIDRLRERLDEMERHQWTANGRIRQDASQAVRAIGFVLLVVTLIWAKVEFEWWYLVVGFALMIAGEASGAPKAYDQEQRRSR
ncbi:hypothetical protein AB5I41_31660 [Sphingomonas sp. MMS24-JH45]